MGGLFGSKPDTSAAEAQIAEQRKETARMKKEAMDEKKDLAEQMSGAKRARRFGGKRSLLSDTRLSPELGVEEEDETLGS
jgi:hypothetical protein